MENTKAVELALKIDGITKDLNTPDFMVLTRMLENETSKKMYDLVSQIVAITGTDNYDELVQVMRLVQAMRPQPGKPRV